MQTNTNNINLTKFPDVINVPMKVTQNDKDTNEIIIRVYEIDGTEITYADLTAAEIIFLKSDYTAVQKNMTVREEDLYYKMGTNEIACVGVVTAHIQLVDSTSRLTIGGFRFEVLQDPVNPWSIKSTSEFTFLDVFVEQVEQAQVDYGDLYETIGSAETVSTTLKGDIVTGSALHGDLQLDISTGDTLHDNLLDDISTGNALHTTLTDDISDANTSKTELNTSKSNADGSKTALDGSISTGNTLKSDLGGLISTGNTLNSDLGSSISDANDAKGDLDGSIATGATAKSNLDGSIFNAGTAKTNLDGSVTTANTVKSNLDGSVTEATTINGTLSGTIESGNTSITELNDVHDAFMVYEEYNPVTDYVILNKVSYNGSSYVCISPCTGVAPPNVSYWLLASARGTKTARVVIGAYNSGWENGADVVCPGTNDHLTINTAINSLPAGGGEIILLDGTYNLGGKIDINKSNVTIRGSGNGTILKRMYNSMSGFEGLVSISSVDNCTIENLQIDGNKATYNSMNNIGIHVIGDNNKLINITSNNSGNGAYIEETAESIVKNCTFSNNVYGLYVGISSDCVIEGSTCNNNGNGGISLDSNSKSIVNGNIAHSNTSYGISVYGENNGSISSNVCSENQTGIYLDMVNKCSVVGNTANDNSETGIYISESSNNTVTGNTCIRGTGLTTDYTVGQNTIKGWENKYNIITSNNCMGKAPYNDDGEEGTGNTFFNNKSDNSDDFTTHMADNVNSFKSINDYLNYVDIYNNSLLTDVYGVEVDYVNKTFTRIAGAVGKTPGADFDSILAFGGRRRCNLSDAGVVNAYFGDAGYIEDGSNGQVMVEQPKFYYKVVPLKMEKNDEVEIASIAFTAGASESGNITITLNGTSQNVAVVAGDDATAVATKVRETSFAGWTTGGSGTTVTFTATKVGAKVATTFTDTGTTGVTGTITRTQCGYIGKGFKLRKARYYISMTKKAVFKVHPAFVKNKVEKEKIYLSAYEGCAYDVSASTFILDDAQTVDFTSESGDILSSIASVKPISGNIQDLTRRKCGILAENRGTGWSQQYAATAACSQLLFTVEYASMNSQTAIGKGVVDKASGEGNESEITGATTLLGNASGMAAGTNGLVSITYRGEENFWGNIYKFTDGMNIYCDIANSVHDLYVADNTFAESTQASPYANAGITLATRSGYVSAMAYSETYDWLFVPAETLGDSALPVGDYFYQSAASPGYKIARLGGSWYDGSTDGAFCWHVSSAPSASYRNIGGRLVYVPVEVS